MSIIEITRFQSGDRGYSKADSSKVPLDTNGRCQAIIQHVENAVVQLRHGQGEPRGLSFAAYKGHRCVNKDTNITAVHALMLDYNVEQFEKLAEAAEKLGYAHLFITTENRARTLNAVTLVIPFTAPLTVSQYARIASCFASELGLYGLLEGALAATHIVNVHATTMTAFVRGELLDGEAYIKRTAKMFQNQDARKWEGREPIGQQAARVQVERPYYTTDDGLFVMPLTDAEMIVRKAHMAIYGNDWPDATPFGRMLED